MKILKILYGSIWMYYKLLVIQPYFRRINQYRKQGDISRELEEIKACEMTWGGFVVEKLGIKVNLIGAEHVPKGPVVFVSNHQGDLDIMILVASIDHQMGFVAKRELQKIPSYGKAIHDTRSIFIDRGDTRASLRAIEEGVEYLKLGFSLTIFPEGTRGKEGKMKAFKRGSLRLATKAEVPVVPITISGSFNAFEDSGLRKTANVDVYIHPPIDTKGMSKLVANNLAESVEDLIRGKLQELNGQRIDQDS